MIKALFKKNKNKDVPVVFKRKKKIFLFYKAAATCITTEMLRYHRNVQKCKEFFNVTFVVKLSNPNSAREKCHSPKQCHTGEER